MMRTVTFRSRFIRYGVYSIRRFCAAKGKIRKQTNSSSTDDDSKNEFDPMNEVGIPMVSAKLHRRLFGSESISKCNNVDRDVLNIIRRRISKAAGVNMNQLRGTNLLPSQDDVTFDIPELRGKTVEEHFYVIAEEQVAAYRELAEKLAGNKKNIPIMPRNGWIMKPGWTKYKNDGSSVSVDYPEEDALVFDVEICTDGVKPTLAVAMSENAWYSWCATELCHHENGHTFATQYFSRMGLHLEDLIPLESKPSDNDVRNKRHRLVIGHNVAFDRSYIKEQYYLRKTDLRFLDTMSMHIATSGFANVQRAIHMKKKSETKMNRNETNPFAIRASMFNEGSNGNENSGKAINWEERGSMNSLEVVHNYYCPESKLVLNKEQRTELFVDGNLDTVRNDFQKAMNYCAEDVMATFEVFVSLWGVFLERFPHPATLAGMLEMGTAYLPINQTWPHFMNAAEDGYNTELKKINKLLLSLANETVDLIWEDRYKDDPWLWDEDWSVIDGGPKFYRKTTSRLQRSKKESAEDYVDRLWNEFSKRTVKNPIYLSTFPKWYRDLCKRPQNTGISEFNSGLVDNSNAGWGPQITLQMRIAPKLLRMHFNGYPLYYHKKYGWGYLLPDENAGTSKFEEESDGRYWIGKKNSARSVFPLRRLKEIVTENRRGMGKMEKNDWMEQSEALLDCDLPGVKFGKLPHKDGADFNVGNPLSKHFLHLIDQGVLMSQRPSDAKLVAQVNHTCSYWRITRDRIMSQLPVFWHKFDEDGNILDMEEQGEDSYCGAILPRVIMAGTVTRRAVEPLWMTASNAKFDRIGSEVKGLVQPPPGYVFVGADVDSQELWIAALLGDSWRYKIHGSTPFSWMLLRGNKADGTDQHSMVAKELGVTRDEAKILNYGRIYGAGLPYAAVLLKKFRPGDDQEKIQELAKKLYFKTKGGRRKYCILTKEGAEEYWRGCREEATPDQPVRYEQASTFFSDARLTFDDQYCAKMWQEWVGGTESEVFNRLESIALSDKASTPVLDCRLSRALELGSNNKEFLPSRINWVVQSSAVDYLHLMIVCMRWLFDKYNIDGRFSISIHDEVRYLVSEQDKYRAALALQITNLLTRAMFVSKVGMSGLPQSIAYFSKVDIDRALRKEVDVDCVTPSNQLGLSGCYRITPGEALNIQQIVEKTYGGRLDLIQ